MEIRDLLTIATTSHSLSVNVRDKWLFSQCDNWDNRQLDNWNDNWNEMVRFKTVILLYTLKQGAYSQTASCKASLINANIGFMLSIIWDCDHRHRPKL